MALGGRRVVLVLDGFVVAAVLGVGPDREPGARPRRLAGGIGGGDRGHCSGWAWTSRPWPATTGRRHWWRPWCWGRCPGDAPAGRPCPRGGGLRLRLRRRSAPGASTTEPWSTPRARPVGLLPGRGAGRGRGSAGHGGGPGLRGHPGPVKARAKEMPTDLSIPMLRSRCPHAPKRTMGAVPTATTTEVAPRWTSRARSPSAA